MFDRWKLPFFLLFFHININPSTAATSSSSETSSIHDQLLGDNETRNDDEEMEIDFPQEEDNHHHHHHHHMKGKKKKRQFNHLNDRDSFLDTNVSRNASHKLTTRNNDNDQDDKNYPWKSFSFEKISEDNIFIMLFPKNLEMICQEWICLLDKVDEIDNYAYYSSNQYHEYSIEYQHHRKVQSLIVDIIHVIIPFINDIIGMIQQQLPARRDLLLKDCQQWIDAFSRRYYTGKLSVKLNIEETDICHL
jgi:hypothetical protein